MTSGSHAAADGSFGRSAGIQVGRAAILLVIATLIGVALLHRGASRGGSGGGLAVAGGNTTATAATTTLPILAGPPPSSATTGTQPLRVKADIKVLVANGTGSSGLAGTVSTTLRTKGYNTLASTNSTQKVTATVVYFAPTYDADAGVLAGLLGVATTAAKPMPAPAQLPVAGLNGANILVIAGPELGGTSSTSSTIKSSTSTTGHTSTS